MSSRIIKVSSVKSEVFGGLKLTINLVDHEAELALWLFSYNV